MIKQNATFLVGGIRIPYAKYMQMMGMQAKAHFYVVDLTDELVREKVANAKLLTEEVFQEFELTILANMYRQTKGTLQYNLNFIFVLPDDMSFSEDMWKIKADLQYMRKLFIKASEFPKILLEEKKKEICSKIDIGEEHYKVQNFNVLSDFEQLHNLELLKSLSEILDSQIVNISHTGAREYLNSINRCNPQIMAYYYQKLWSMFEEKGLPENPYHLSLTEQRMLYLASLLGQQKHGQALLIDGIDWRALDDDRRLNLITTLSDFSEQSGSVFITCENKADIDLIKKKVYRANFMIPKLH